MESVLGWFVVLSFIGIALCLLLGVARSLLWPLIALAVVMAVNFVFLVALLAIVAIAIAAGVVRLLTRR
jgi:hypothetical protein